MGYEMELLIAQIEKAASGTFNLSADPVAMGQFVEIVRTERSGPLHWAEDAFLIEQGVAAFNIPLWIPVSEDFPDGFFPVDNAKAKKAGLSTRSARESAEQTREWLAAQGQER